MDKKPRKKYSKQTNNPHEAALRLLSIRDYSRREMIDRLGRKGFNSDEVQETANWLSEHSFINDEAFCQRAARQYQQQLFGARAIAYKLHQKGFDQGLIAQALQDYDTAVEQENAQLLLARRRRMNSKITKEKFARYLLGRGYAVSVVQQLITCWHEET